MTKKRCQLTMTKTEDPSIIWLPLELLPSWTSIVFATFATIPGVYSAAPLVALPDRPSYRVSVTGVIQCGPSMLDGCRRPGATTAAHNA